MIPFFYEVAEKFQCVSMSSMSSKMELQWKSQFYHDNAGRKRLFPQKTPLVKPE